MIVQNTIKINNLSGFKEFYKKSGIFFLYQ